MRRKVSEPFELIVNLPQIGFGPRMSTSSVKRAEPVLEKGHASARLRKECSNLESPRDLPTVRRSTALFSLEVSATFTSRPTSDRGLIFPRRLTRRPTRHRFGSRNQIDRNHSPLPITSLLDRTSNLGPGLFGSAPGPSRSRSFAERERNSSTFIASARTRPVRPIDSSRASTSGVRSGRARGCAGRGGGSCGGGGRPCGRPSGTRRGRPPGRPWPGRGDRDHRRVDLRAGPEDRRGQDPDQLDVGHGLHQHGEGAVGARSRGRRASARPVRAGSSRPSSPGEARGGRGGCSTIGVATL